MNYEEMYSFNLKNNQHICDFTNEKSYIISWKKFMNETHNFNHWDQELQIRYNKILQEERDKKLTEILK